MAFGKPVEQKKETNVTIKHKGRDGKNLRSQQRLAKPIKLFISNFPQSNIYYFMIHKSYLNLAKVTSGKFDFERGSFSHILLRLLDEYRGICGN
jgi:hypothetical protein